MREWLGNAEIKMLDSPIPSNQIHKFSKRWTVTEVGFEPTPPGETATWTQRLRPLGHSATFYAVQGRCQVRYMHLLLPGKNDIRIISVRPFVHLFANRITQKLMDRSSWNLAAWEMMTLGRAHNKVLEMIRKKYFQFQRHNLLVIWPLDHTTASGLIRTFGRSLLIARYSFLSQYRVRYMLRCRTAYRTCSV